LGDRVQDLCQLGYFDAAVREACVALEHQIKTSIGSDCWGDALVKEFIWKLRDSNNFLESYLRVLRMSMAETNCAK